MNEQQMLRANRVISGLRQQRDAANDQIIDLSVKLSELQDQLDALKRGVADQAHSNVIELPEAKEA